MDVFYLLSENMQKKIWDMGWTHFMPIQEKVIPSIISTHKDIIISSGTASGKTEAAFLPILSLVEENAREHIKVIYISPLKALINNQFERIEKLCDRSDITIHRWHGDVSQNKKKKLVNKPVGILQITPESIESLFINQTGNLKPLFQYIEFIVIDEIHSFIGKERGVQLRSLISRVNEYIKNRPRIIGLSATIGNFDYVKQWVNPMDPDNVEIISLPGTDKELYYHLMHLGASDHKKPVELFEDIRELTREKQSLIFCNSRGQVEETTVYLNRLAEREGCKNTYFAHHSSIDKKEREFIEKTMANTADPKSVVATSSLELGIDVGKIDIVIQIDSTFTVSSLKQRLGRSGRKRKASQILQLYSTEKHQLLQSLAVMELILEGWIEPAEGYNLPYDILFHQIISMCHSANGTTATSLTEIIKQNDIFYDLPINDIQVLVQHMVNNDYLEKMRGTHELIVGIEGERILRDRDFYAVFMTTDEYEVFHGTKRIGALDKSPFINTGDNIILSGKLWTIKDVDPLKNKVYVQPAVNGKPPKYFGGVQKLHPRILHKMMEILCSDNEFTYLNDEGHASLNDIRKPYHLHHVTPAHRPLWVDKEEIVLETYTGTNIFRTLYWMFKVMGVEIKSIDGIGRITFKGNQPIKKLINKIKEKEWSHLELLAHVSDKELFKSKYVHYLPEELHLKMHAAHEFDVLKVKEFLNTYKIKEINL